jgi:hypothetical protein
MALSVWQASITDEAGNIIPGASVSVHTESTGAVSALYADRAGSTPLANPFLADDVGFARFYVRAGAYRIEVTSGDYSATWRYNSAGLLAELDYIDSDIRTAGAACDGVTDDTAAIQQFINSRDEIYFPAAEILVTSLTIPSGKKIRTAGLTTTIVNTDPDQLDLPIIVITGSNVAVGDLHFEGAIADQSGEWNHCIAVRPDGADIDNVIIGRLTGNNVRGDVLALEGTDTYKVKKVSCAGLHGENIYRSVFSCIGAEDWFVGSITGSEIGYRLWDIEPNASGSQAPTGGRIGYSKGAAVQFAGDATVTIGTVECDYVELDNDLNEDSTPGYPGHAPDAGNIGILFSNTAYARFGVLKARNFGERLFNDSGSTLKGRFVVDHIDVDDCNTTETTYKALFYCSTLSALEIRSGTVVLQGSDRYLVKCESVCVPTLNSLAISGGCVAASASLGRFDNLAINASGVSDALFAAVNDSQFRGVAVTSGSSATLMNSCSRNKFSHCSGTFSALNTSGGVHTFDQTTFNSVSYGQHSITVAVAFNPAAVDAGATLSTLAVGDVSVPGAAVGDFVSVSFADTTTTNHGKIFWTGRVIATDTVRAFYTNTHSGTIDLQNDTLRVRVWKL